MSRIFRATAAFKNCSGSYPWRDFVWLLQQLGYELKKSGKTAGSRRKYWNKDSGHIIMMDEPHDGEMVIAHPDCRSAGPAGNGRLFKVKRMASRALMAFRRAVSMTD